MKHRMRLKYKETWSSKYIEVSLAPRKFSAITSFCMRQAKRILSPSDIKRLEGAKR